MDREILLVRHGKAKCSTMGVIAGDTCEGLTSIGRRQVEKMALRLLAGQNAGRPIAALYTSSVRRARETALAIGGLTDLEPELCRELRVPEPGPADGVLWEDVRRRWPPDPDRPTRPLIDGGEAWQSYLARAQSCLSSIVEGHRGGRVVVVGHSETVTAAFTLLVGVKALGALQVDLAPTGITQLIAARERPNVMVAVPRWALAIHNDTAHLRGELDAPGHARWSEVRPRGGPIASGGPRT